jgi:hypothetical protein
MPNVKKIGKIRKEGRKKISLGLKKRMILARLPVEMRANFNATAIAISPLGVGTAIPPVTDVYLLDFDFVPIPPSSTSSQAGCTGYDINWPGPPRRKLEWGDVRFYKPVINIKDPAPLDVAFWFYVYDDVVMWSDTLLASFYATIRQGSCTPTDSDIICLSSGDEPAPLNAPTRSYGAFWIGATEKGNIKGNEGKNGRTANVYFAVDLDYVWFPSGGSGCPVHTSNDESARHPIHTT